MRRIPQDRSEFFPGPARKSADRETERLTDVIDTKSSTTTGTISFEVTGAAPTFIGEITGEQGFYVAPVVDSGNINMSNTVLLEDGLGNLPFIVDASNEFGVAANSIVGKLDASNGAAIYDFQNGSASALTHGLASNQGGYRASSSLAVSSPYLGTSTPTVAVIQNGAASVVTLTAPSGHPWLQGVGVSTSGNLICAVWTNNNSTGSGTAVVALHALNGSLSGSPSATASVPRTGAIACLVDNGRIAFVLPTSVWAAPADASSALVQVASTGVSSRSNVSSNISSDGYIFMNVSNDLYRVSVASSLVSVWPEVFSRSAGSPAVTTANVTVQSMYAISSTKLVYGGVIFPLPGSMYYPLYTAVVLAGT